ncbi:uncharacterized protein LOC131232432 [Magnolia sinica]|uniref:uncharacterized protein LOC131232432 n=1 Tax=Magnolia sinica TaxID=86752 RepID=UPI00265A6FEC|nr:uncharacterized protein LOC131232432 [Magnolia sinica]
MADFLAAHPMTDCEAILDDFPDEQVMVTKLPKVWQMFFDGAARATGAGAGVIFITPQGDLLPYSFKLGMTCTNNEVEYNALIIRMDIASELGIKHLQIYGDSKLVINQVAMEFEARKLKLLPYCQKTQHLLVKFLNIEVKHIPRYENVKADALASLAAALSCLDRSPL